MEGLREGDADAAEAGVFAGGLLDAVLGAPGEVSDERDIVPVYKCLSFLLLCSSLVFSNKKADSYRSELQ